MNYPVYITILLYNKRSYMFRCLCTIFRELWYCLLHYKTLKLFKLRNSVGRCVVNSFLIILHINSLLTFQLHLQPLPQFINSTDFTIQWLPWRWDPTGCPETSARNYHSMLRNFP